MKISVIGTGYVGLVTGACLAEMGNSVLCLDIDRPKVERLARGELTIHEPGLAELVRRNLATLRLRFTDDVAASVDHGTVQIIGVGTPAGGDDAADVRQVLQAARDIGGRMSGYKVIVDKSTVPVGTAEQVRAAIDDELRARGLDIPFAVVSNPEFLKEGAAVEDFMRPDRVIIGGADERAMLLMRSLYAPFTRNHERLHLMDTQSAEFTKYAANAMLATRISFMNELALLADRLDVDIESVRRGIGSDPRIGHDFLYAGAGYGGSCFPKDVRALIATGRSVGVDLGVLKAVDAANERQKHVLLNKIEARFGAQLDGCAFALWGLAFKPETDDLRDAPSRVLIDALLQRGARVKAYDPVAMPAARRAIAPHGGLSFADNACEALQGCDALVVITDWKEFKSPDFDAIRTLLKQPLVFDGRNLYEPELMQRLGIVHVGIGRGTDRR